MLSSKGKMDIYDLWCTQNSYFCCKYLISLFVLWSTLLSANSRDSQCRVYTVVHALTFRQRWSDFVLHRQQYDINHSDLQLYLTDITSQEQRASSSNYIAALLPEAQPSMEKAKTRLSEILINVGNTAWEKCCCLNRVTQTGQGCQWSP